MTLRRAIATGVGLSLAFSPVLGCGPGDPATSAAELPDISAHAPLRAPIRVRVEPLRKAPLGELAEAAGVTAAFRSARVAAEVTARVVARRVEPGARVQAGLPVTDAEPLGGCAADPLSVLNTRAQDRNGFVFAKNPGFRANFDQIIN